jgi:hypothetical protein
MDFFLLHCIWQLTRPERERVKNVPLSHQRGANQGVAEVEITLYAFIYSGFINLFPDHVQSNGYSAKVWLA